MPYTSPVSDFRFLFEHVVDLSRATETDLYAEATPT